MFAHGLKTLIHFYSVRPADLATLTSSKSFGEVAATSNWKQPESDLLACSCGMGGGDGWFGGKGQVGQVVGPAEAEDVVHFKDDGASFAFAELAFGVFEVVEGSAARAQASRYFWS
jgi:hypothetical protein